MELFSRVSTETLSTYTSSKTKILDVDDEDDEEGRTIFESIAGAITLELFSRVSTVTLSTNTSSKTMILDVDDEDPRCRRRRRRRGTNLIRINSGGHHFGINFTSFNGDDVDENLVQDDDPRCRRRRRTSLVRVNSRGSYFEFQRRRRRRTPRRRR